MGPARRVASRLAWKPPMRAPPSQLPVCSAALRREGRKTCLSNLLATRPKLTSSGPTQSCLSRLPTSFGCESGRRTGRPQQAAPGLTMDFIGNGGADPAGCKSLYVGNLHPYVNEAMLQEIFSTLGPVLEVKVIKDKVTGLSAGYGFVKFLDHRVADLALQTINGRVLYGQEVRVNWAFQKDQREDTTAHFHIFVGDLSSEVTDRMLLDAFQSCGGCSDARVMWDHSTGRSKGYGFVSFRSREDAESAIQQMNGSFVGHRRVRCGWAQHKADSSTADIGSVDQADPQNSNVYVGNIAPEVSDQELRRNFQQFGNVVEVKTYRKGSYGFVHFERHADAVHAIVGMNGQVLGNKPLKCGWGRHQLQQQGSTALNNQLAMMGAFSPMGLMGPGPAGLVPGMAPMMMPGAMGGNQNMLGPQLGLGGQMGQLGLGLGGMRGGTGGPMGGQGGPQGLRGSQGLGGPQGGLAPQIDPMYLSMYYGQQ